MSASAAGDSPVATQLLLNAVNPIMSVASNTAAVRQITPSTPIVLSAEALTSLLMMNSLPPQQQAGQAQLTTSSVELNAQIMQYVAEQAAAQTVTLAMDSSNVPTVTELTGAGSDLEVGAQEMVLEEGSGAQKPHPLHLN